MRILFLNVDLGYGGAEKNLAFVANSLVQAGHDVKFLTYRINNNYQVLDNRIIREHIQLESSGSKLSQIFKTINYLRQYVNKNKIELAIAFLSPSQLRLIPACIFTKTKVLVSQRGDPYMIQNEKKLSRKIILKINEIIFKKADFFVFQTKKAMDYYPKKLNKKSCIIPNPIVSLNRTNERNRKTTKKEIVTVSRLEIKQKRQDILIKAFVELNKKYPEYVLKIYGSGEDEEIIKKMISSYKNIYLCGMTQNIVESIQNSSIFVLTSDYEGIPNSLIEALSLGVPCISTKCSPGGAEMLIENMKNGILIDCNDSDKLVEAMKFMIENNEIAEEMGCVAMEINSRFLSKDISNKWVELIRTISY